MNAQERHQFALFAREREGVGTDQSLVLKDADLVRRMTNVLRLQVGDEIILFDRQTNRLLQINAIKKKEISGKILAKKSNLPLKPHIKLLLPVLKKEALSDALYNAVEAGANEIQLIYTYKAARPMAGHDLERLERVAIAAAEQSKHFSFPVIQPPIPFERAIALNEGVGIFFDPNGSTVAHLQSFFADQKKFHLLVGPEGDLTHEEKELLRTAGWHFCALTLTILRASQAVSVGLGIWRSLLR